MSETLFRFLVQEIKLLRIICKNPRCGSVMEIPLARMADWHGVINCPACARAIQKGSDTDNYLANLAAVLLQLQKADYVDVGFSLPIAPETQAKK